MFAGTKCPLGRVKSFVDDLRVPVAATGCSRNVSFEEFKTSTRGGESKEIDLKYRMTRTVDKQPKRHVLSNTH